jgi:hypothetical protein
LKRALSQDHPSMNERGDIFDIYWIDWDDIRHVPKDDEQLNDLWHDLRSILTPKRHSFDSWQAFDRFRHINADYIIFSHSFKSFFPNMREYVRDYRDH